MTVSTVVCVLLACLYTVCCTTSTDAFANVYHSCKLHCTKMTECASHDQCPEDRMCTDSKCVDPCEGWCGDNANCSVHRHFPVCTCKPGYTGDPHFACEQNGQSYSYYIDGAKRSYYESMEYCRNTGMELATFDNEEEFNRLADLIRIRACKINDHCPDDRECKNQECVDPCEGQCGDSTVCEVLHHSPFCGCKPGYTGNPSVRCTEIPECESHDQCPEDRMCTGSKCVDPCEGWCGDNANCSIHRHFPVCTCKPGHTGNPLFACELKEKSYFADGIKRSFLESMRFCKNTGMEPATFDNEAEFNRLADLLRSRGETSGYWVAGSDLAQRDVWMWITTGRQMTFLPWGTKDPNHLWWDSEEQRYVGVWLHTNGTVDIYDDWSSNLFYTLCEY